MSTRRGASSSSHASSSGSGSAPSKKPKAVRDQDSDVDYEYAAEASDDEDDQYVAESSGNEDSEADVSDESDTPRQSSAKSKRVGPTKKTLKPSKGKKARVSSSGSTKTKVIGTKKRAPLALSTSTKKMSGGSRSRGSRAPSATMGSSSALTTATGSTSGASSLQRHDARARTGPQASASTVSASPTPAADPTAATGRSSSGHATSEEPDEQDQEALEDIIHTALQPGAPAQLVALEKLSDKAAPDLSALNRVAAVQAAQKPSHDGEDLEEDLEDQREINGIICNRVWTLGREASFYEEPVSKIRHYNLCRMPAYEQDNTHEQILDGARRFAVDFIEGRLDLGINIPSWLHTDEAKKRFKVWISGKHVDLWPFFLDLLAALCAGNPTPDAAWLDAREARSITAMLASLTTSHTPAADVARLSKLLRNIIYMEIGYDDLVWLYEYIGKSKNGLRRLCEHAGYTALAELGGAGKAMLHYQLAAKAKKRVTHGLVTVKASAGDADAQAECLASWEFLVQAALAACQLNEGFLNGRARYKSLPPMRDVVGANGTLCLDGPSKRRTEDGRSAFGIVAPEYEAALHVQGQALSEMVMARFFANATAAADNPAPSTSSASPAAPRAGSSASALWGLPATSTSSTNSSISTGAHDAAAAERVAAAEQRFVDACRAVRQVGNELFAVGKMLYCWSFSSLHGWRVLRYLLPLAKIRELIALYPEGTTYGEFAVLICATEPSHETDLAISCPEELIPKMRGIQMAIGRADFSGPGDPFPVKIQHTQLPLSDSADYLYDRAFLTLKDHEQQPRLAAQTAKVLEMAERDDGLPAGVSLGNVGDLAYMLWKGKVHSVANTKVRVTIPDEFVEAVGDDMRVLGVIRDDVESLLAASQALGLGNRLNIPAFYIRLIIIGGDGIWDFSAEGAQHAVQHAVEMSFGLVLLAFNGDWVPLPKLLSAKFRAELVGQLDCLVQRMIANAGRQLKGHPVRPLIEHPPGIGVASNYKVFSKVTKGKMQYLIYAFTEDSFFLPNGLFEKMFGEGYVSGEVGNVAGRIDWTTNAAAPGRRTVDAFRFFVRRSAGSAPGATPGPWYEFKPRSQGTREKWFNIFNDFKEDYKALKIPFPSIPPPTVG